MVVKTTKRIEKVSLNKEDPMELFLSLVGGLGGAALVVIIGRRLINRLTNPIVKAAHQAANDLSKACFFSERLPNGTLLQVADPEVMQIGEAMLLDGAPTEQINRHMLKLIAEKLATPHRFLCQNQPATTVVGYRRAL